MSESRINKAIQELNKLEKIDKYNEVEVVLYTSPPLYPIFPTDFRLISCEPSLNPNIPPTITVYTHLGYSLIEIIKSEYMDKKIIKLFGVYFFDLIIILLLQNFIFINITLSERRINKK